MSALDEMIDLDQKVAALEAAIGAKSAQLREVNRAHDRAADKRDSAQSRLAYHESNLNHMRQVADVVSLREYAKVVEHRDCARADLQEAMEQLAVTHSTCERDRIAVRQAEERIAEYRTLLRGYGQVVDFPSRPLGDDG